MIQLTLETVVSLAFNFLFYFIIGSLGAFLKDLYETLTKKNEKIRLSEVLIGGISATFICLALQDFSWFGERSIGFISLVTFVMGVIGFEIFGNITTISKLKDFFYLLNRLKNTPPNEWDQVQPPPPAPPTDVVEQPPVEETPEEIKPKPRKVRRKSTTEKNATKKEEE